MHALLDVFDADVALAQAKFATAALACDPPPPGLLAGRSQARVARGFRVYRNNIYASLTASVLAKYPVVQKLVGAEFAAAAARVFVEQRPPHEPVLLWYGADFPDFLDSFEPAQSVPYLTDVARLEWAICESQSAADSHIVGSGALLSLAPEAVGSARLKIHPAMRVVGSLHPIHSIWSAQERSERARRIPIEAASEIALVVRPAYEVRVFKLGVGSDAFIRALARGATIDAAVAEAFASAAGFDLATTLVTLFESGAVSDVVPSTGLKGAALCAN